VTVKWFGSDGPRTIELCGDPIARPAHRYQFPTVALQIRIFLVEIAVGVLTP
jgi:hypothetical protein